VPVNDRLPVFDAVCVCLMTLNHRSCGQRYGLEKRGDNSALAAPNRLVRTTSDRLMATVRAWHDTLQPTSQEIPPTRH